MGKQIHAAVLEDTKIPSIGQLCPSKLSVGPLTTASPSNPEIPLTKQSKPAEFHLKAVSVKIGW
jgi:hypothetical protein